MIRVGILVLGVAMAASTQATQVASSTTWHLTTETDPMTDKTLLRATAQSVVADRTYELRFTCHGDPLPAEERAKKDNLFYNQGLFFGEVMILAFSGGEGTAIPWTYGDLPARRLTLRIDDQKPFVGWLIQKEYANAGNFYRNVGPYITNNDDLFGGGVAKIGTGPDYQRTNGKMPQHRLLVSGVFPDEVVEFSFASLSSADRAALETSCVKVSSGVSK